MQMAQAAPLLRQMAWAHPWFHVLLVCPTLWYWVCRQLAPLPCHCWNIFPPHTLQGNAEGQHWEPGTGLQQLPLSSLPIHAVCFLPLASWMCGCTTSRCPDSSFTTTTAQAPLVFPSP